MTMEEMTAKQEIVPPAQLPEHRTGVLQALLQDEAGLLAHLRQVHVVPLLLVHTHLSGDEGWLERFAPHIKGPWTFDEYAPEALKEELRQALVGVLRNYRESGQQLPPRPPEARLRRMLDVAVGQPVTEEYFALVLEEMNFEDDDPKAIHWRQKPADSVLDKFKVLVIGAGFSGLDMAAKLKEAGIDFVLIEKNEEVGGTWFENSYPGCAVDTPNHFYSYSFRLNPEWDYYFARRNEIFRYIKTCYAELNIAEHVRFREEVVSTIWDAQRALWNVRVRRADGSEYTLQANAVVSATGLLNRPAYPNIPGMQDFKGPMFHSARWDHSVDLAGKRVVMVGTGASGLQIGPNIAPIVDKLTIFQRSPPWAIENKLLFEPVNDAVKWALSNIPFYAKWFRLLLIWASSDAFYHTLKIDPDWTEPESSLNAENKATRERLVAHITKQVNGDPELLKKVIPSYPPYGKRMLRDANWYKTLTRDNVELVDKRIGEITPTGVVDSDGVEHPADVIILATGFTAQQPLHPMEVVGTNGSIRDHWGEDNPRAHLGVTVPDFPNFFILYGPNTNGGHGGSAVFHSECQVRYTMQALREMLERGADTVAVRRDAFEDYNARVDAMHRQMVWSHPGVNNWYRNKSGRVVTNSPWRLVDYRNLTAEFDPAEYEFQRVKSEVA
ncbi:NAD(P)/FAD-dependent oxidoreductase [Phenylobacterium sp. LjRoot219]|uniref:flavin-containing monooxygenase n=1 Tax=Phenylobacterium sp. LjRoot219 TaxID=3342283 RepID=UPI003ED0968A